MGRGNNIVQKKYRKEEVEYTDIKLLTKLIVETDLDGALHLHKYLLPEWQEEIIFNKNKFDVI